MTEQVVGPRQCANCGATLSGPFCSACGQRTLEGRHTLRSVVASAFAQLFNLERGLVHTMARLTVDPGGAVNDYLAGRTAMYVHPFSYLIICFAIFALVNQFVRFVVAAGSGSGNQLLTATLVIFLALASRVVFWRTGRSLAEHVILNVFLFAHSVLLLIPLGLLIGLLPGTAGTYGLILLLPGVIVAYFCWAYSRVFETHMALSIVGALASMALGAGLWVGAITLLVRLLQSV